MKNIKKKISVTKRYTFEAAHRLESHQGKCKDLHGHSYKLEVTVTGEPKHEKGAPDDGMVIDFSEISKVVEEILTLFDHKLLNDVVDYTTTAENIANDIFDRLVDAGLPVSKIQLWETEKCSATVEVI